MSLLEYFKLGRTVTRGGGHELFRQHFKLYDAVGGFGAFHNYVRELNVDTSSLVKQGMPLNAWCDNYTLHPINAFGAAAAAQVNRMTNFGALTAGAATIFGPQFLETCKGVMEDKTHFLDTYKAVLESKTRFFEACELLMENKTRFLEACEEVMATKTWYFDPYKAMSEIKTWFLEACEKFLEIKI